MDADRAPLTVAPLLVLDAATDGTLAAIVASDAVLAERRDTGRGAATERLAGLVSDTLSAAGLIIRDLAGIAVTVGPGSFTGLRAALALAHGLALGAGLPIVAVTLGEAIRAEVGGSSARPVWVALDSRRGRIFLDRDGELAPFAPEDLPAPDRPIVIAGDAASLAGAALTACRAVVTLSEIRQASATGIANVARLRLGGLLPPLVAMPLYVDPPEAKLPAGGLRPAPV